MRPSRLELSGFTSFRDVSVIDFADADYFALVGPTGSGKSTIIDAICFALYGSVPRYDDERLVHPVITQGQLEARVRLDFSVNGDTYTAVRVARRAANGKGASTREARLERGGEVLAGTATEVTAEVTRLIGLTFGHFTKCVVLPQGQFARFLHDEPSARQELLVRLLNLGVYERMRQSANLAVSRLREEIALGERRLDEDLGFATPETLRDARARVEDLGDLYRRLGEATPTRVALKAEIARLEEQVSLARRWADQLGAVRVPEGVLALAERIGHAEKKLAEAEEGALEAERHVAAATAARRSLPDRDPLAVALIGHRRRADLAERAIGGRISLSGAEQGEGRARMAWSKAEQAALELLVRHDAAKQRHLASHLARALVPGAPCP
ncbi:MAG: AAA family ATPase, partial [Actinomycetota bacterium]